MELQALLDEDDSQTQEQLVEQLGVSQQAVSDRLREMGKIQKSGGWVPHELNDGQMEKRKNTWHFARSVQKEVVFASCGYKGWKVDLFWEFQTQKSWVELGTPSKSTERPNRVGRKTMLCVWWYQKGVVCYKLLKTGKTVNTKRYRQQLTNLNRSSLE